MYVPTLPQGPVIDTSTGYWTAAYQVFFASLIQNLQQDFSNEGLVVPNLTQQQMATVEEDSLIGTLVFNTDAINGGSSSKPNGQLYIRLADGAFHPVTNT